MSKVNHKKPEHRKLRADIGSHPLFSKNNAQINTMIDGMDAADTKKLLKFLTKAVMSILRDD